MHELDAERLAIGAAYDGEDLAQCCELEAEHPVEENRTVHVGIGETVRARIELLLVLGRLEAERVEIGVEMSACTVGSDQHQGLDRVAGRLLDLGSRQLDAAVCARALTLSPTAFSASRQSPSSAPRRCAAKRPVRLLPGWAAGFLHDLGAVIFEALEERSPILIDRLRVGLVAGMKVLDIVGVAAVEKRGAGESGIGILSGHPASPVGKNCDPDTSNAAGQYLRPYPYTIYAAIASSQYEKLIQNSFAREAVKAKPAPTEPQVKRPRHRCRGPVSDGSDAGDQYLPAPQLKRQTSSLRTVWTYLCASIAEACQRTGRCDHEWNALAAVVREAVFGFPEQARQPAYAVFVAGAQEPAVIGLLHEIDASRRSRRIRL